MRHPPRRAAEQRAPSASCRGQALPSSHSSGGPFCQRKSRDIDGRPHPGNPPSSAAGCPRVSGAASVRPGTTVYRWVDHTAELELRVDADSEAGVFRAALDALGELLGDDEDGDHEPVSREVAVEAPDRPALLAAWLEELVYLAESEGLVPERAEPLAVEAGR